MTALLMPPPVAESYRQLDFSWEEPASSRVEPISNSTIEMPLQETQPEECLQSAGETQAQMDREEQNGILRFREDTETGVKRIAEPVRIGGVMIKLLKRYGITDAEISEGLENYAAKHGRLAAS